MAVKAAQGATVSQATEALELENEDGEEHQSQESRSGRAADPFDKASKAAEEELGLVDEDAVDQPPIKAKPAKKAEKPAKDAADKKAEKPAPKKEAKVEDDADEHEEEDAGDDDGEAKAKSKKVAVDPNAPLEPKPYWPRNKRFDFQYLPREEQEKWLNEPLKANDHWPTEVKDTFAKQPREVQEALLEQAQSLERGFSTKFNELASERKLAEAIRKAVPDQIRTYMQARNMDEVAVFSGLLRLQQQSMQDPIGYMRDFIVRNKVDLRRLLDDGSGTQQADSPVGNNQADVKSHPDYVALKAEFETLKGHVMNDVQRREQDGNRRISGELDTVLMERDDRGALRYPYARLLQTTMAQILDAAPEQFGSMGVRERFVESYALALEAHPELKSILKAAVPAPVDEPDDEDADPDEETPAQRLKRVASKKSKAAQTPPKQPAGRDAAFARASAKAEKQLGYR